MTNGHRAVSDHQLGLLTASLGVIAAALAALAVYAAIPPAVIALPQPAITAGELLLPQGWAFFTANPQSVYPQPYERSGDGTWVDKVSSLAAPSALFGLNRSLRALSAESSLLLRSVPARSWRTCTDQPARCLLTAPVAARVVNTSPLEDLCGDVGFARQQALPWAWRNTGTVMPSLVVRVEVSCA